MNVDILRGVKEPFLQSEYIIRQTYMASCCDWKADKVCAICSEGPEFNSPWESVHGAGRREGVRLGNCLSFVWRKNNFYIRLFKSEEIFDSVLTFPEVFHLTVNWFKKFSLKKKKKATVDNDISQRFAFMLLFELRSSALTLCLYFIHAHKF